MIWEVHLSPDQVVWVQALAGDIVLCSSARQFTLTVLLSTQVYKLVLANLMLGLKWYYDQKNNFFFFGFQNYVNLTLTDPSFKFWF